MGGRLDKFICESREFRGEQEDDSSPVHNYIIVSMFFLIIFVTGCSATYASTKSIDVKHRQTTDKPK